MSPNIRMKTRRTDPQMPFCAQTAHTHLCIWVLDSFDNKPQTVMIHNLFFTIILSTGSSRDCLLRPIQFTLLTQACSPNHPCWKYTLMSPTTGRRWNIWRVGEGKTSSALKWKRRRRREAKTHTFTSLGLHVNNNNTSSLIRKADQKLYFLGLLMHAGLGVLDPHLTFFYSCLWC